MSYDTKCADLAEHFLDDVSLPDFARRKAKAYLAQHIQNAVETWLDHELAAFTIRGQIV